MAMVVKNNMSAISTLNTLNKNSSALAKSLEKVSSGMKINSAADDASGYAISERMRVQIRSLDQANQNTQNGNSMMKTAEGAVSSTVEILKTLKEKVINAANDTNTDSDRQTIQKELNQSIDQIDDNANITFNGKYLVDGSKNTIGTATQTRLSNQALSTDTAANTDLTALKARNGDDLEISSTDKVTVSYVQGGKTYSTVFQVGDLNGDGSNKMAKLSDIFLKAESIDTASKIFANAEDADLQKIDSSLASAAAQIPSLETALNNAQTTYDASLSTYNSDSDVAAAAAASLAAADADLDTKAKALANAVASFSTMATAVTASLDAGASDYIAAVNAEFANLSGADKNAFNSAALSAATASVDAQSAAAAANSTAAAALTTSSGQLATDKTALDTAQDNYNAAAGPTLLVGEDIGFAASKDKVSTASGQNAITITAASAGIQQQIAGFNINVTDSEGNVKKSVNAALDAFDETIRAQNKSEDNAITLQVGAKANQSIKVGLTDMRSEALGLKGSDGTKLNISTQVKANAAVNVLDNAIQKALDQQTTIGSIQSRLSYTSSNLTTASENVQASESAIRDADMAKEMTNYTKNNVLLQAAQSMLAQANQNSSAVLSLLQ